MFTLRKKETPHAKNFMYFDDLTTSFLISEPVYKYSMYTSSVKIILSH